MFAASACGSSSGSAIDAASESYDAEPGQTQGAPMWDRTVLGDDLDRPALAVSESGTIDVAAFGRGTSPPVLSWITGTPGSFSEESVTAATGSYPSIGRDQSGVVHIAWQDENDAIRYANNGGGDWTADSIATDRFRPDMVVAADGTPHLVFVDRDSNGASAYYATTGGMGWTIETVASVRDSGDSRVSIALDAAGAPIVAGTDTDDTHVWVATRDGAPWTSRVVGDMFEGESPLEIIANEHGVAIAYKTRTDHRVAFATSADGQFTEHDIASYGSLGAGIGVLPMAGDLMMVGSVGDDGGIWTVEGTGNDNSYQKVVTSRCEASGIALGHATSVGPVVAFSCWEDTAYVSTIVGTYPSDWDDQCQAGGDELCVEACQCPSNGEECCWSTGNGSTCTSTFGCSVNAPAQICADATITPAELDACRAELAGLTCDVGLAQSLPASCEALEEL
jgi:hypothetical protein